jgi:hypothetical protein
LKGTYIDSYSCTSDLSLESYQSADSRRSFFSAHAACMAYGMTYLTLYIQNNFLGLPNLARAFVQFLLLTLACVTGISRITDNLHFSTDVLAGFIVGSGIGIWIYLLVEPYYMFQKCNFRTIRGLSHCYARSPQLQLQRYSRKQDGKQLVKNRSSFVLERASLLENQIDPHPFYQTV